MAVVYTQQWWPTSAEWTKEDCAAPGSLIMDTARAANNYHRYVYPANKLISQICCCKDGPYWLSHNETNEYSVIWTSAGRYIPDGYSSLQVHAHSKLESAGNDVDWYLVPTTFPYKGNLNRSSLTNVSPYGGSVNYRMSWTTDSANVQHGSDTCIIPPLARDNLLYFVLLAHQASPTVHARLYTLDVWLVW